MFIAIAIALANFHFIYGNEKVLHNLNTVRDECEGDGENIFWLWFCFQTVLLGSVYLLCQRNTVKK